LGGEVNLLMNPDFQQTYAARRLADPQLPGVRSEYRMLPGYGGQAFLPYGWSIMPTQNGQGIVSLVRDDDGKPALRLQTRQGESLLLQQSLLELVPGATYSCGLQVKGTGRANLKVRASDPALAESLAEIPIEATSDWKRHRKTGKVGWHRHLAGYQLLVTGKADLLIRGAELVTAGNASPATAGSLDKLGTFPDVKEADTLFYEGFDGKIAAIKPTGSARLTELNGGRFGRGLATSSAGGGMTAHLEIGELPPQGTLEFWFKPAVLPAHPTDNFRTILVLSTQSKVQGSGQLQFANSGNSRGSMMLAFSLGRSARTQAASQTYTTHGGWGWWQPDTWHHLAGSWDGEAMRFYVDGVLSGITHTKDLTPPQGTVVSVTLPYDGVIDEIRLSKALRYGPVVPSGCQPVPFNPPAASNVNAEAASEAGKEITTVELDGERAKLTASVPECKADYMIGIEAMHPAWEGMPGIKPVEDFFAPGMDGLEVNGEGEVGRAVYCRLEGIEAGTYYIGLWTDSGDKKFRTEYHPSRLLVSAYVNGWPLRFATTTEPVQVRPGLWLCELQTAAPVALKNGDEIAFCPQASSTRQRFLRLALYRKEPIRGHGITGRTFGLEGKTPQRLRLVIQPELQGTGADGTEHTASIRIANPLPYAVDTEVTWKLADYFGAPVEQKTQTVHIEAHRVWAMTRPFTAQGDAQAYQLDVRTRPARGFILPCPRPVEWLDLNDYTRMEFLPHQPGPLEAWMHVRKDLVDNRTAGARAVCLDGPDWEFAYLDGRRVPESVPPDLKFTRCAVPVVQGLPKNRFGIWYRTKFRVPEWLRGQNVLIDLYGGVEETLFLNGRRVGQGLSRVQEHGAMGRLHLPSAALSQALRLDAENELVICVRGGVALMNPDFVDQYDPSDWNSTRENQDRQGTRFNTIGLHDLWLRSAPPLRVRQSLVVPDVEKGQLRIFTRVENESDQPRRVELQFQVYQNGVRIKVPVPAQTVTVEARSIRQVMVDAPAGKLTPYTPKNPVLAKLTTLAVEDGAVLHRLDQRFGYRAFQVRGMGMLWNGNPVKFLGAVFRGRDEVFEGEDGLDIVRSSHDLPTWLAQRNLYDEIGYLIYPGPGVALNEAAWKKLNNQHYWDDSCRAVIETVWDVGSHPCVAGWNMSNESYHYAPYLSGKEAQDKLGERIFEVVQAVRREIWPGFWFLADGDENLGGRLDFCSFHYLNHGGRTYDFRFRPQLGTGDPLAPGISHFPPDSFHLNGASEIPRLGSVLPMNPDWAYGSSACGDTESFGKGGGVTATAKDIGDRAALSAACQWSEPRGVAWNKMALDAYRDMEAFTSGMYWESALGVFAPDVSFSLPQQAVRYYAGARFDRRMNIHDDEYAPGDLDFRWAFVDGNGKTLHGETFTLQSTTAFLERRRIAFDLPAVTHRTQYTLAMELSKNGRRMAREERRVEVWPAPVPALPAIPATLQVAVFDPAETVSPLLKKLGCAARKITALDKAALAGAQAVLIAPDSVTNAPVPWHEALHDYTRQGGRVLILHQEDASLLPADITLEKRTWVSQGYVCAQDHPVMQGLKDVDFCMWNPDHLIARGAFRKPARGNVITLVDSAHLDRASKTPTWSEVIEIYLGTGSMIAVQLPLVERFETEPMAAEMLRRMLVYMGQPVCRKIDRRLAVLGRPSEAVTQRLNATRVDHAILSKPDPAWPVTLLDLNGGPVPADAPALRAYVESGGTLIVHRVRPEHAAWLESLTGKPVKVRIQPYQMWADRQVLERRGGLLDGLNNLDFYWRPVVGGEAADSLLQVSSGLASGREIGQVLHLVEVAGVTDHLFPGGLVEVPIGKGRVIVDQLKWEAPGENLDGGSPTRVLSVLLTNLGIVQKQPSPKRTLPPGMVYTPIDLATVVNRSLVDEKAGDGLGWADWGPEQDLRDFPPGAINLAGIPFHVVPGTNNAVALRTGQTRVRSLAAYPTRVAIPVNRQNVAGLWFLHTGGWMNGGNAFAWREIRYTDGSMAVIALNESNTGDWNTGRDEFPVEEDTTTTVAWRGACRMYPVTRVYKTLWVNPHPEKAIKEVVLTTRDLPDKDLRFLVHLGLTAAILPEGGTPGPAPRDAPKSQTLLQEALTLIGKKQPAAAATKLNAALQADDQNTAAWKELAALTERTAEPAAMMALCQKWIQAMPNSYEAHNVLGQFLEKQYKRAEALAEYKKSLVIEWNQPSIEQARKRLEESGNNTK
jgi:hypothetical protein